MRSHELPTRLQRVGVEPLYWIVGEESLLREQAVAWIKVAVTGGSLKTGAPKVPSSEELDAFSYDLLYGDESDGEEILCRAREISLLGSRRLVVVKAADRLSARDGEALRPYFTAPCETTTLVFEATRLDSRTKWVQTLKQCAQVVECTPLAESHLAGWIRTEAQRCGVRLNEQAVMALKEWGVGASLFQIRRELEKLASFVPPERTAEAEDIEAVRGEEPNASVFDLAEAIAGSDRHRALAILKTNLDVGEAPLRILGALVWQYRRLWKGFDLVQRRQSESAISRSLGVPPFRLKPFLALVNTLTESQLDQAFHRFTRADSALKGGSASAPAVVMEFLVLSLCKDAEESRAAQGRSRLSRSAGAAKPRDSRIQPGNGSGRAGGQQVKPGERRSGSP